MKRISIFSIPMVMCLLGLSANLVQSQDQAACITRCNTVRDACDEPCKREAREARQRCEDAGGSVNTCEASYHNTLLSCFSRTSESRRACMDSQGCRTCFNKFRTFYCECGDPFGSCGLEFDGGGSNSCECEPDDPNCTSPIILDVAGDGYRLTNVELGVRFDLRVTGTPIRTAWTEPDSDDAWLALDRNGNGTIDNGSELFGNFTPQPASSHKNGFLALAEFDKTANGGNGDDLISGQDSVFTSLRLWQDRNHNGVSEQTELLLLPAANVQTLSLDYKESRRRDGHGNLFRYRAKVNEVDYMYDVFLVHE